MADLPDIEKVKKLDVKSIVGLASFVCSIIIGVIFVDDRYAHADDVNSIHKKLESNNVNVQSQLELNRLTGEVAILNMRKSNLEDKVYDTAVRQDKNKKPVLAEQLILDRYRNELNGVNQEILYKSKLIDKIKSSNTGASPAR